MFWYTLAKQTITIRIWAVLEAIEEELPDQSENSISIKLPNVKELSDVYSFVKDIDTNFKQVLVDDRKTSIRLQNFDTRSNWIEIVIENRESIVFVGGMVKMAFTLLKDKLIKPKQTEEQINALSLDEQVKVQVLKVLEQTVQQQGEFYASALMKEFNITKDEQEYHTI